MPTQRCPAGQLDPDLRAEAWRSRPGSRARSRVASASPRPSRHCGLPLGEAAQQRGEHVRRGRRAPSAASEVAPGWSGGAAATFSPIPTTTAGRTASATSARIPATLRWPGAEQQVVGPLQRGGHGARPRGRCPARARPASSGSQPNRDGGTPAGRSSTLTVIPVPGGSHPAARRAGRGRRPGARRRARCGPARPSAAAASRSALVEPVRSTTSSWAHGPISAARSAAASSGSTVRFMPADATGGPPRPLADPAVATGGGRRAPRRAAQRRRTPAVRAVTWRRATPGSAPGSAGDRLRP